jgi:hypothetical protein
MKHLGTCQAVFLQMKQGFLMKIRLKKPVLLLYLNDRLNYPLPKHGMWFQKTVFNGLT